MVYLLILAVAYILHQHQISKTNKELYNEDVASLQQFIEEEIFNRGVNPFGVIVSKELTDEDMKCLFKVVNEEGNGGHSPYYTGEPGTQGHQRPVK